MRLRLLQTAGKTCLLCKFNLQVRVVVLLLETNNTGNFQKKHCSVYEFAVQSVFTKLNNFLTAEILVRTESLKSLTLFKFPDELPLFPLTQG